MLIAKVAENVAPIGEAGSDRRVVFVGNFLGNCNHLKNQLLVFRELLAQDMFENLCSPDSISRTLRMMKSMLAAYHKLPA